MLGGFMQALESGVNCGTVCHHASSLPMTLLSLFPTLIYQASLPRRTLANRRLLDECEALRLEDRAGQRWSRRHYSGGYTSYGSLSKLHRVSSPFAELERVLRPHVMRFVRSLDYDMRGRELAMTDCWANVMRPQTVHSWHLHPLSFISGTYYVAVPDRAAPIKFEDPRLDRLMAAPPRRRDARRELQPFHTLSARAGDVVLFESWLRHEVPASEASEERVSISFNYAWSERPARKSRT
jgi:uncharacterized protein (TIGR02466 family)